jgi:hypothetical protein
MKHELVQERWEPKKEGAQRRPSWGFFIYASPEERQNLLWVLVRNRQGLSCELLLGLKGLKTCSFFFHFSINHAAYAELNLVGQCIKEVLLRFDGLFSDTEAC